MRPTRCDRDSRVTSTARRLLVRSTPFFDFMLRNVPCVHVWVRASRPDQRRDVALRIDDRTFAVKTASDSTSLMGSSNLPLVNAGQG